jgi:hypothetical protein
MAKTTADEESKQAAFLSLAQIAALETEWRAKEIYHYPKYLEEGGAVFPLSVIK